MSAGEKIGFIGAGNMAEALARGLLSTGKYSPASIIASDVREERRNLFAEQLQVQATASNLEVVRQCRLIILAVKPNQMEAVLKEVAAAFEPKHLIISIAAGISTHYIESFLKEEVPVIRVMPNTPILVGAGMTAISAGRWARPENLAATREIFESASRVIVVEESLIDAITALSGSGPAYFFYLVEAMKEAGVTLGLTGDDADLCARQTAFGAGKMLIESEEPVETMRKKVTSPGGTTEAAISKMEEGSLKEIIIRAVKAAAERSRGIGK